MDLRAPTLVRWSPTLARALSVEFFSERRCEARRHRERRRCAGRTARASRRCPPRAAICPATGDSGPTSDSAIAPTRAAALSSTFCSGISPAAIACRSRPRHVPAVRPPIDETLRVDQRVDRLVEQRPSQSATAERPPSVRGDRGLETLDAPPVAAASSIAARSRLAASRKTSTKSSALEGKCRYSAPAETPARSAIACTDAAA